MSDRQHTLPWTVDLTGATLEAHRGVIIRDRDKRIVAECPLTERPLPDGQFSDAMRIVESVSEIDGLRIQNETMTAVAGARERQFSTARHMRDDLSAALRALRSAEPVDYIAKTEAADATLAAYDAHIAADAAKVAKVARTGGEVV